MRVLLSAIMILCVTGSPALLAAAQPTFGRPKGDRPKPTEPDEIQPDESVAPVMNDWRESDPERAAPNADAAPGVWYAHKTAEGFRYAWSLPAGYEKGEGYNLIVIFHPDNQDFRWGIMNHRRAAAVAADGAATKPAGMFRPGDILVSFDGVEAPPRRPNLRSFPANPESAVKCRDVLLELSRVLPVQRIYLYGYGGGGRFAQYMGATFPAVTDGVLAQSAGLGEIEAVKSTVPIVLMHGAKDSMFPLRSSLEARDAYEATGHDLVRVRVLRGFNDFVNPARASECIDWIDGMRTQDPREALAAAERMLTPRGADDYGYVSPVWFTGAYELLARVAGDAEPRFSKDADATTIERARALMQRIDDEGIAYTKRARQLMGEGDARTLALDGGPWLGFLLALRDDFRNVPGVEAFFREIAWEFVSGQHAAAASELIDTWTSESATDAEKFEKAVTFLPRCYLYEALPVDLPARARVCMRKADDLDIAQEARDRYEYIALWDQGCRDGLDEYQRFWSRWRFEPGK